jgi:outer membrane receptor for ferric coprogen and ferric-rhodotorulic acid
MELDKSSNGGMDFGGGRGRRLGLGERSSLALEEKWHRVRLLGWETLFAGLRHQFFSNLTWTIKNMFTYQKKKKNQKYVQFFAQSLPPNIPPFQPLAALYITISSPPTPPAILLSSNTTINTSLLQHNHIIL